MKRKRSGDAEAWSFTTLGGANPLTFGPRPYTLSVAFPCSIVSNAQSSELKTYLVGQIARALAINQVDEVIVWDDSAPASNSQRGIGPDAVQKSGRPKASPLEFFCRVLQYVETPQYLRKALIPMHPDLRFAGLLNPLDAPHHLRQSERCPFREGVVLKREVREGEGSLVNCGLPRPLRLDLRVEPGLRVTVRVRDNGQFVGGRGGHRKGQRGGKRDVGAHNWSEPAGEAVSPDAPREELGLYWGYQTRAAGGLAEVLAGCPWEGGYDLTVGTSEKGTEDAETVTFAAHAHALVVFGGLEGIEAAVEDDDSLRVPPEQLFDHWVNTCPSQGSRTIRTEEALLISLARLQPKLDAANRRAAA